MQIHHAFDPAGCADNDVGIVIGAAVCVPDPSVDFVCAALETVPCQDAPRESRQHDLGEDFPCDGFFLAPNKHIFSTDRVRRKVTNTPQ